MSGERMCTNILYISLSIARIYYTGNARQTIELTKWCHFTPSKILLTNITYTMQYYICNTDSTEILMHRFTKIYRHSIVP